MLSPPGGLPADALAAALDRSWGVTAARLTYRPVGFGSHHWEVAEPGGQRWFVTADELEVKRLRPGEPPEAPLRRLTAALTAAGALRAAGAQFVVAPVPAADGGVPVVRVTPEFAVSVYPFVSGQSFQWGAFADGQREAVLDMVAAVHTAPPAAGRAALPDEFVIPQREDLELALDPPPEAPAADCGPYAKSAAALVAGHAGVLRQWLGRYDALASQVRDQAGRMVLTHGEPHPGNTMLTEAGWRLVDWDTALRAPPERDLWSLDPGDGSILAAYAAATGVTPRPDLLELYRIRWDLADVAACFSQFRRPHTGTPNDEKTWELMQELLGGLAGFSWSR